MSRQPVRVLIAEDHPIFREGLRFLLHSLEWAEVVGEAETGLQAVEQAAALRPDVVAMDLQLPELHGIEATRRILAANPQTRVLVLTMFDDDDSVFAAMRAGALGYLVKGAKPAEVAGAIQAVAGGEAIFGPAIARRVIDFFAAGSTPRPLPPTLAAAGVRGDPGRHRPHRGQDAMATLIATASAVTAGAVGLWLVVTAALAFGAGPGQDPGATQALYQVRYLAETFWSLPVAALTAATAVAALRGRVLPRWRGWFSAAAALAFLVGGADMARAGFFATDGDYGFLLFWLLPLWLLVTGIGLLRRPRAAHDATAAPEQVATPVP